MLGFTRQQLIFLGVVGVIAIVFLAVFFVGGRNPTEKINLTVWGIDDAPGWDYAISRYQKLHPNVRIKYTELKPETYEKELINALAAGRGPDIFMINNRWTVKHADKIAPSPVEKIPPSVFRDLFPQVAEYDFLSSNGQVYGLPLSIDTLALFYNRDIFDKRGVALFPETWEEFLKAIPKLRTIDKSGQLILPAAAIGGSTISIPNAPDILELLMLQTGALTPDEYPSQTVDSEEGERALEFYIQFTNPRSQYYAWSDASGSSVDSFAEGKTAMLFAYANDAQWIKAKNPFLNFAIVPAPQADLNQAVSVADYWGLTASSKNESPEAAWDFIVFAATDKEATLDYLTSTGRPPALRSLINEYLNDSKLGAFARQALTARSFYEGDDEAVRAIFDKAIRDAINGNSIFEALREVEAELYNLEHKGQ
ncbi:MAG: extracellular solute-binding protein [Candidatus Colwellbacteria bacterium]